MKPTLAAVIFLGLSSALCIFGQQGPPPDWDHGMHRPPSEPPPGHSNGGAPPGRWWHSPDLARRLNLSAEQQKRMDEVYEQSRNRLIDLRALVQKEEGALEPMLGAEHVDEAKATAQIDRVAAARAELEKANARMLLSLRTVLTQEQWRTLQYEDPRPSHGGGPH
jgi:Spy/CpxP family protein refolding chaperone